MKKKSYVEIVSAWITYQRNWWAFEELDELIQKEPHDAWLVIRTIFERITDYKTMGALAAGPLEELLSTHGEIIIGEIETYAATSPEFRKCLSGVWQNAMSNELYARVTGIADPDFKFE